MTNKERAVLLAGILEGADIMDRLTAIKLRQIQKQTPVLIEITASMHDYEANEKKACFGAIATKQGEAFVRKHYWCDFNDSPVSQCDCPDCGSCLIDVSGGVF